MHRNDVAEENCAFFRTSTSSAMGHAGINCILELNRSDVLTLMIKDLSVPPKDVSIYQANMNMVLIDSDMD